MSGSYRPGEAAQSLTQMTAAADLAAPALAAVTRGAAAAAEFAALARAASQARTALDRLAATRSGSEPAASPGSISATPPAKIEAPDTSSLRGALAPLEGFAGRMEVSFNRVGGTIVTLARRIDDAMKTPALETALAKTQGWLKKVATSAKEAGDAATTTGHKVGTLAGVGEKVIGVYRGFLKIRAWIANMGDVAGKDLTQVSKLDFSRALSGTGALKAGMAGVGGTVGTVTAGVKVLAVEIAAALGVFSLAYGAVRFFKNAVTGASDLNESMSATKEVFKGSFDIVGDQVDSLAEKFGLNKKEMLDGASAFGSIAQGAGYAGDDVALFSNTFTKLAADFSSLKNISLDEAFTKIQAGLSGEMEPLRRYGVVIDEAAVKQEAFRQGLASAGGDLDNHAKTVARAALIQRGLAAASGDLERTGGGAANQFRRFGGTLANTMASVGGALMPMVDTGMQIFNRLAVAAAAALESIKPRMTALAASVIPAVGKALAWLADTAHFVWSKMQEAGTIVAPYVGAAMNFLSSTLHALGRAAIFAGKAWVAMVMASARVADAILGTNIQGELKAGLANLEKFATLGPASSTWGDEIRGFFDSLKTGAADATAATDSLATSLAGVAEGTAKAGQKAAEMIRELKTQITTFGRSAAETDAYKLKVEGASDADSNQVYELTRKLERLKQVDEAQKALKDAAKSAIDETRNPLEKYQAKVRELDELRNRGLIDTDTFNRASSQAFQSTGAGQGPKLAGAAVLGTREAYSAIVSDSNRARPEQRIEKIGEKHLTESQKQTPLLQKLVDLATGRKAGEGLDGFAGLYSFGGA